MLSTLQKERQTHAEGRARVREYWENLHVNDFRCAYKIFRELPGEGEECPDCRCCSQSVRAYSHRWEGVLKMNTDAIKHNFEFERGKVVRFEYAIDVLLETSRVKHHTELTLYWAHVVNIFALIKYVAMGERVKPRQEMERRFPSIYFSVEEVVQLMTDRGRGGRIYVLSYSWHSAEHPNPTGSTAKTVMEGLKKKASDKETKSFVRSFGKGGG
uniref:Uncharacterized protein n=1 Tax=Chromera velia CCMP2878 TaxID=1169474 RepID=A0A0G4F0I9_9ALVE|eukprot:Cvel_14430.t1-p1 / transcript=Cvel_14430.t1 / gene=Cvel_14430 / organism=Chromera_velia_CCMP2878 / gene_product=hypothetical protein / transcript_product=hypothetical protein / location=Cvel_scaffold1026:40815-41453(-) / protein_length=213 / sequence_SO=supercontig / SO=protein_coding / is_pseudo=false